MHFSFGVARGEPGRGQSLRRQPLNVVATCLWLMLGWTQAHAAGNPNSGNTLFNTATPFCMECHISPPEGGRLSAANNTAVISNAIANDYGGTYLPGGTTGMGRFSATGANTLSATQLNNLSAYFGWYVIPTTSAKSQTVAFNSSNNSVDLSANITVGTPVSVSIASGPSNGTVGTPVVNSAGANVVTTVTYTPTAGFYGSDSFTYTATNIAGTSTAATVTITVSPPPAPVTSNASPNVSYGSSNNLINLNAFISGFTTGSDIEIVSGPNAGGTINSTSGETVTYTPAPTYSGNDVFTYRISNGGGASNTSTVTVSVGLPPAPVAGSASETVAYNSTNNDFDLTASITNPSTSVAVTVSPTNGTINSVSGNIVTYTPDNGYYGPDSFSYTATGPGGGPSAAAVVSITVSNPPAPTAGDLSMTVPFNTAGDLDLSTGASGVFSSVALDSTPSNGAVNLVGNIVTYTPDTGFNGSDSFTYTTTGPGGTSAPATVNVTVSTQIPGAGAASMTVAVNSAASLDLAPFITGSSISRVEIASNPANGQVFANGTSVLYIPAADYFGTDSFTYTAFGNAGESPTPGVVTVTITGRPDPTRDPNVISLINTQVETARRFLRAQVSNFHARMESLHRPRPRPTEASNAAAAVEQFSPPAPTQPKGAAYRPAANISSDPAAGLKPATASGDPISDKVAAIVTSALQSSSLNFASDTGTPEDGGFDYWVGGGIRFGRSPGDTTFDTDGISTGVDTRYGDNLVLGIGFGYANDKTEIGDDGTRSSAKSFTIAAYGSYQPAPNFFIDGVFGGGTSNTDTRRYVTAIDDFALGERSGEFIFGSLSAGYDYRFGNTYMSPYGRLDYSRHKLGGYTETDAGLSSLTYDEQSISGTQFALGVRVESASRTEWVLPRMRLEFQHDFESDQETRVSYADAPGQIFVVTSTADERNSVVLGVGSDFLLSHGFTLSVDYQMQQASQDDMSQAVFFRLSK
jgi:uncharacterized protein with beta-barrel porin domain